MTRWQELPLRPHGQPWPGLNTRRGFLSRGDGALDDGSINAVIEREDVLMKRRGLVRGLDEYFGGPVCGLFKYTDQCGREWLIVADEFGIGIRQPFVVPVFETSDAYPQDSFSGTGAPSSLLWRNTARYTQSADTLVLVSGAAATAAVQTPSSFAMRWFKDAGQASYQVRVQFTYSSLVTVRQRAAVVIRGAGDLSLGALIQGDLEFTQGGTYRARLWHRRDDGTYRELAFRDVPAPAQGSGFFTLRYSQDVATQQFIAGISVVANGGVTVDFDAPTITAIEDADLGLTSAIALDVSAGASGPAILAVDGGPL